MLVLKGEILICSYVVFREVIKTTPI